MTDTTGIKEYTESMVTLDPFKQSVFNALSDFPWIERIKAAYAAEDSPEEMSAAQHATASAGNKNATKLSCLRTILQMLRNNKDLSQLQMQAGVVLAMANDAVTNKANDSILAATGLLLMAAMVKQYASIKRDTLIQHVDVNVIIEIFERTATV